MRLSIIVLGIILIFTSANEGYTQEAMKIGVVNSDYIIGVYPRFREVEAQMNREVEALKRDRASWERQMETLQEHIIEQENLLRAGTTTFSEKRRMELAMTIDSLRMSFETQFNERMTQDQEKLQNKRAELLSVILEDVNEVIQDIGKENDYDLIFDSSNGTVVYAKDPDDLTDMLLRRLQDR